MASDKQVNRLADLGIKNSQHLFRRARTAEEREELARLAGIPGDDLLKLVKLSDLVRVAGIGAVSAPIFYDAGADTTEKLAASSLEALFESVNAVNPIKGYTIQMRDIDYCVQIAKELPFVIEYQEMGI